MLVHKSQYFIHMSLHDYNHAWKLSLLNSTHCMVQQFMHILPLKRILKVIIHNYNDMNAIFDCCVS